MRSFNGLHAVALVGYGRVLTTLFQVGETAKRPGRPLPPLAEEGVAMTGGAGSLRTASTPSCSSSRAFSVQVRFVPASALLEARSLCA